MATNKKKPLISVALVTYNRLQFTKFYLKTFFATIKKGSVELIVVDNHSTDGTRKFLKKEPRIDKLILNPKNYNLGKAINQAWTNSNPDSKWLAWTNNDFFYMDDWFENFKKVVLDLNVDYVNCLYLEGLTRNKILPGILKTTKTGGAYIQPRLKRGKKFESGAATIIRHSLVKKHKIELKEITFRKGSTGPGPPFYKLLFALSLKGVRLGKPCLLLQDVFYEGNTEYYKEVYSRRGMMKVLKIYKEKGYVKNPRKYYEGTNYLERRNK